MRKTMVYLEEEQFLLLRKRAQQQGRSMAELIREALRRYLRSDRTKMDYFSFVGIARGPKGEAASEQAEEILKTFLSQRAKA